MNGDEEIFGKRPKEYFQVREKKSVTFIFSCLYMSFMGFIPVFLGVLGFMKIYFPGAAHWFFIFNIFLGILMIIGSIYTFKFKKWGIYLFGITLLMDIFFHLSLGFEELDAINGLYLFIGFALIPIVPRWKFFN